MSAIFAVLPPEQFSRILGKTPRLFPSTHPPAQLKFSSYQYIHMSMSLLFFQEANGFYPFREGQGRSEFNISPNSSLNVNSIALIILYQRFYSGFSERYFPFVTVLIYSVYLHCLILNGLLPSHSEAKRAAQKHFRKSESMTKKKFIPIKN